MKILKKTLMATSLLAANSPHAATINLNVHDNDATQVVWDPDPPPDSFLLNKYLH